MRQISSRYIIALIVTVSIIGGLVWLFGFSGQATYELADKHNPCLLEAHSLLHGTLELPVRVHDSASYQGHFFNVFQPGQTLFFLAHLWFDQTSELAYFRLELALLLLLSVGAFFHGVFRLSNGNAFLAACLTLAFFGGAPYMASFPVALQGSVYRVNHCFSILFFALLFVTISGPLSDRRCVWAGLWVGLAVLFRMQNIIMLSLPILQLCSTEDAARWNVRGLFRRPPDRRKWLKKFFLLLAFPLLASLVIMGGQAAKFGNPLETGYASIYEGRTDYVAARAQTYGIMSSYFLPENLFRTFWSAPQIEFEGWRIAKIVGDPRGNSLIFSQPIVLFLLMLYPVFRSARMQAFLAASLLMALPVWLYHNPGLFAPGYMRLSLDYAPMWFAMLAAGLGMRTPAQRLLGLCAAVCTIWSVSYVIVLLWQYPV